MIQKVDSGEPGCPPGFFLLNYPERGWAGGPPFAIFEGWEFQNLSLGGAALSALRFPTRGDLNAAMK